MSLLKPLLKYIVQHQFPYPKPSCHHRHSFAHIIGWCRHTPVERSYRCTTIVVLFTIFSTPKAKCVILTCNPLVYLKRTSLLIKLESTHVVRLPTWVHIHYSNHLLDVKAKTNTAVIQNDVCGHNFLSIIHISISLHMVNC